MVFATTACELKNVLFDCEDCFWEMTLPLVEKQAKVVSISLYSLLAFATVLSHAIYVMIAMFNVVFYFFLSKICSSTVLINICKWNRSLAFNQWAA